MNFIFISPNYPSGHWKYVEALRRLGVNVLGIGDAGTETFPSILRGSLTEYYRVGDLHDYEAVYRACAYFIHKYGRIGRIESLNPYWRDLEARLREEYHVAGADRKQLEGLLNVRSMMETAKQAGVPVVASEPLRSIAAAKRFAAKYGYPIAVRPIEDKRLETLYITGEAQLNVLLKGKTDGQYLLCAAPAGDYISCDGLSDDDGKAVLCCPWSFVEPPEKVAVENGLLAFCSMENNERLKEYTDRLLGAFSLGSGFFHFKFVRLSASVEGTGEKGDFVLLGIEFNPPEEYLTDALCYAAGMNVYDAWAAITSSSVLPECTVSDGVVGCASRRFDRSYKNAHEMVLRRLGGKMCSHIRTEGCSDPAVGDYIYMFRASGTAEMKRTVRYIQEDFAAPSIPGKAKPSKAVAKAQETTRRKNASGSSESKS